MRGDCAVSATRGAALRRTVGRRAVPSVLALLFALLAAGPLLATRAEARADGEVLRWGADPSGGAPFAFLDPAATADIARTLGELSDAGMAIVFVTHDIAFAERVATRTMRLVDGRLAPTAPGSPRDDVRDPRPIPPA